MKYVTTPSQQQRSRSVEGDRRIYDSERISTEKSMLKLRFENWQLRNVNDNRTLHQTFHSGCGWRLYSLPDEYYSLLTYDPVFNTHLLPTCRRNLLPTLPGFFDRHENGNSKALQKSITNDQSTRGHIPEDCTLRSIRYQHSTIERRQTLRPRVM